MKHGDQEVKKLYLGSAGGSAEKGMVISMKSACILGHQWATDYQDSSHGLKIHTCRRCGQTEEHTWHRMEHECADACTKCHVRRFLPHSFVEKTPCHLVCEICGHQEERHHFTKESECVRVCSQCGEVETRHTWNKIKNEHRSQLGLSFWSVGQQSRINPGELPAQLEGCICQRCKERNPDGVHIGTSYWHTEAGGASYYVTKCSCCGDTLEKLTREQKTQKDRDEDIRRQEQDANRDEAIFR